MIYTLEASHKPSSRHHSILKYTKAPIGYIRNCYRESGKVKNQTIAKIHGLPLETLQSMKPAFDGKTIATSGISVPAGGSMARQLCFTAWQRQLASTRLCIPIANLGLASRWL